MKKDNYLFKSERLGFRNWKNGDLDEFIKLNSDDKVMEHFPNSLSKNETGKLFTEPLGVVGTGIFYMYKSDFLKIFTLVERL